MNAADVSKIVPISFIAAVLGWRYISVPLYLRRALWTPADPFERVGDENLPPDVEKRFEFPSQVLIGLGYSPIGLFLIRKPHGRIEAIYFLAFLNRETADIVAIRTVHPRTGFEYIKTCVNCIFIRIFSNKTSIATGNGGPESIRRPAPEANRLMLSEFSNLTKLYAVHLARCSLHQGDRLPLVMRDATVADELRNAFIQDRECDIAAGYLERTESPAGYQPSLKGAFVFGWCELWPLKGLRRFAERRRANIELRSLGFGGIKAFYRQEELADSLPLNSTELAIER
jgi:hypothetical protein